MAGQRTNGAEGKDDSFVGAVGESIDTGRLLPAAARIVVGVSGGADSLALLAALRELAPDRRYELIVAHMDHAIRTDAAQDVAFVRDLAERWRLPCVIRRRDVRAEAGPGESLEQAARRVRYEFLAGAAQQQGASFVAVGHHADDNVETVLYRILRGTHMRGLAGMPAKRRMSGSTVMLVRPLLSCRRKQIEAYCRRCGLSWRQDSTNADTRFRRNFIRNELLPLLRDRLNPAVDETLLRLAAAAGQIDTFLTDLAAEALDEALADEGAERLVFRSAPLLARPAAVRTTALRVALERVGLAMRSVGASHLLRMDEVLQAAADDGIDLPGGWRFRRDGDQAVLFRRPAGPDAPDEAEVAVACPGVTMLADGRRIRCCIEPFDAKAFAEHCRGSVPGEEWIDADRVVGALRCRPRKDGDRFRPLGSPGEQTVSYFLTNLKLRADQRGAVRCVVDTEGIVYLAPLRIAERVRATAATRRLLHIALSAVQEGNAP